MQRPLHQEFACDVELEPIFARLGNHEFLERESSLDDLPKMLEYKHPFGVEHGRALLVQVDQFHADRQLPLAFGDCEIDCHIRDEWKLEAAQAGKRAQQAVLSAVRVAPAERPQVNPAS